MLVFQSLSSLFYRRFNSKPLSSTMMVAATAGATAAVFLTAVVTTSSTKTSMSMAAAATATAAAATAFQPQLHPTATTKSFLRHTTTRKADATTTSEASSSLKSSKSSTFAFGVIADVQWADTEDGYNFGRTVKRCYRGSFQTLGAAVDYWRDYQQQIQQQQHTRTHTPINNNRKNTEHTGTKTTNDVIRDNGRSRNQSKNNEEEQEDQDQPPPPPMPLLSFIAQLGDIIDGVNVKLGQSDSALQKALQELDRAPCPSIHLIGNHELYNFNRKYLSSSSWLRHGDKEYYSFQPTQTVGWRMIVLDPYQISLLGFQADSRKTTQEDEHEEEEEKIDIPLFSTDREAVKGRANEKENPTLSISSPIDDEGVAAPEKREKEDADTDADDPRFREAVQRMAQENPNISPAGGLAPGKKDWFAGIRNKNQDGSGTGTYQRRWVPYNGGFGTEQLAWFQGQLAEASHAKERVIVLSHVILHPKACGGGTMAWDYQEALDIIHAANLKSNTHNKEHDEGDDNNDDTTNANTNVVVAVLCGHDHTGYYHQDEMDGVHHCTFSSPLNKGLEGKAFGMITVSPSRMEIRGPRVDDLLPNVEGRPAKATVLVGVTTNPEGKERGAGTPEAGAAAVYEEVIVLPFGR